MNTKETKYKVYTLSIWKESKNTDRQTETRHANVLKCVVS